MINSSKFKSVKEQKNIKEKLKKLLKEAESHKHSIESILRENLDNSTLLKDYIDKCIMRLDELSATCSYFKISLMRMWTRKDPFMSQWD